MSSPSPYAVSRPSTYFPSARHPSMYRQTDYHDGKGVQIIESRRSTPMTSVTMPAPKVHDLAPLSPRKQASSSSRGHKTSSQPSQLRSTSISSQPKQSGHVTPRSSPKSRGQVVIVQGTVSVAVDFGKRDVAIGLTTPPPTPKIERLATPELEDLEDISFCDCCTGVHFVKYCAACGCELESWKS
ncbi:hypothetical protein P171DRAFT_430234 [Karstenula rhodostoma CBS 690.94]|uniref:Uncharacterized protein n=1 Tax=Karstenula rhodostoma CBS 690.94 TaxID=1392251 RepID=A0A9P4UED9_9PLEO|nr:hypothetical protein P171DRAFT_430234 [Karstenula rhodostoma CBS 690.94]